MHWWYNVRSLNLLANAFLSTATLTGLLAVVVYLSQLPYFYIRSVEINEMKGKQLHYVSAKEIRDATLPTVQENWFRVDLNKVKSASEQTSWVRKTVIRRIWPNRLLISVEEHQPSAIWGENRLINSLGEIFKVTPEQFALAQSLRTVQGERLPRLSGPEGTQSTVLHHYERFRKALSKLEAYPEKVFLSPRHAWTLELSNGTTILLGREQESTMADRLTQWVELYPAVVKDLNNPVDLVDLRYRNGFAIRQVS